MLRRNWMPGMGASLLAATLFFGGLGVAHAAPADDLREAQRLYTQGRLPNALEKVEAYLKAMPRDPQGRFLKGLVLTEQKKSAEAIQVFVGLTEDYPELPEPYNNLAVLYAQQGNYDKAKSALELAIHTHPSYATAHENLGDIYAQLASRAYDRALSLDKSNTTAQLKLAMVKDLFVAQKDSTKADPAKAPPKSAAAPKAIEPARVEAPAKAPTPAKADPSAKADPPAKAAPPVATTATPAADAPSADEAAVAAAVGAWAKAWAAKDVKRYLAAYAPDFSTPGGIPRADWEAQRTERIEKPKSIEVIVKMVSVKVAGNEATAVFRQTYRSDTLKSANTKTLKLVKAGDKWLIRQESVGG